MRSRLYITPFLLVLWAAWLVITECEIVTPVWIVMIGLSVAYTVRELEAGYRKWRRVQS